MRINAIHVIFCDIGMGTLNDTSTVFAHAGRKMLVIHVMNIYRSNVLSVLLVPGDEWNM